MEINIIINVSISECSPITVLTFSQGWISCQQQCQSNQQNALTLTFFKKYTIFFSMEDVILENKIRERIE